MDFCIHTLICISGDRCQVEEIALWQWVFDFSLSCSLNGRAFFFCSHCFSNIHLQTVFMDEESDWDTLMHESFTLTVKSIRSCSMDFINDLPFFWIWLLVCIAYKMFLISSEWSFPVHLAAAPVCSVSEKKKITLKNTVASDIFEMLVHREKSWRAQRTNQLKPSHSTKNGLNISKQTMLPWCHWCLYLRT